LTPVIIPIEIFVVEFQFMWRCGSGAEQAMRNKRCGTSGAEAVRNKRGAKRCSPIVQVHVVVWKGEGAELWVKRCTVKSLLCPGSEYSKLLGTILFGESTGYGKLLHTELAELLVKLPYLTARIPLLAIAPP
jgi:hypothetical protein